MFTQSRPAARVAMLSAGLTLALTGTAQAVVDGTVTKSGTNVQFTAAANDKASSIQFDREGAFIIVRNPIVGGDVRAGAGCSQVTAGKVKCSSTGVTRVTALGGDGNDKLFSGDELYLNSVFQGQNGNDWLGGTDGMIADDLRGGAGNDTLFSDGGNDKMIGEGDTDSAIFVTPGSVTVTLDGQANDGMIGATGNVQTENVLGSGLGDRLTGDNGPNILIGSGGNDRLVGLNGNDTLDGGVGNDTIDAKHALLDTDIVDCGSETDSLTLNILPFDPQQNFTGCETVVRKL